MKAHAKTVLIGFATGVLLLISGSMFLVAQEEKNMEEPGKCLVYRDTKEPSSLHIGPQVGRCTSIVISGGVSGDWLTVRRDNEKDYEKRWFDPSWTNIQTTMRPIVKRLGKNSYEVTFESDLP